MVALERLSLIVTKGAPTLCPSYISTAKLAFPPNCPPVVGFGSTSAEKRKKSPAMKELGRKVKVSVVGLAIGRPPTVEEIMSPTDRPLIAPRIGSTPGTLGIKKGL